MALVEISISIMVPEEKLGGVIDALAYQNGYTDTVEGEEELSTIPNLETKPQFIKRHFLNIARASYKAWNDKLVVTEALATQPEDGSDFE